MIYTIHNPKLIINCFCCFQDKITFTGVVKDKNNTIVYYLNSKLHRIDGPAVIYADGNKRWFLNNKFHREDGPAVTYPNGDKVWYLNDTRYGKNDDFTNESWSRFTKLLLLK